MFTKQKNIKTASANEAKAADEFLNSLRGFVLKSRAGLMRIPAKFDSSKKLFTSHCALSKTGGVSKSMMAVDL